MLQRLVQQQIFKAHTPHTLLFPALTISAERFQFHTLTYSLLQGQAGFLQVCAGPTHISAVGGPTSP